MSAVVGIRTYTQLDFAPTGWEGYVVGLPPEEQIHLAKSRPGHVAAVELCQPPERVCRRTDSWLKLPLKNLHNVQHR